MKYLSIIFILSIAFFYTSCSKEDDPIPTDFIGSWEHKTLYDTSTSSTPVVVKAKLLNIFTNNTYESKLQFYDDLKKVYVDIIVFEGNLTYTADRLLKIQYTSIGLRERSITGKYTNNFFTYNEGSAEFNVYLDILTEGSSQLTLLYSMINENKISLKEDINYDGKVDEKDTEAPTEYIRVN